MTRKKVDEMLKAYRFEVGRCGHLEAEISQLEKAIRQAMATMDEDVTAVRPQQLSGMPHGTTVGNPTEKLGIMLASGWVPDDILEMQAELKETKQEHEQRYFTVLFVSAWLNGLPERERWIVEHQVIDGEYWKEVVCKFKTAFQEETSKDSLKRLKQRAMEKIYQMAE